MGEKPRYPAKVILMAWVQVFFGMLAVLGMMACFIWIVEAMGQLLVRLLGLQG